MDIARDTGRQKDDVDKKYRDLYALLWEMARAIVADASVPSARRYEQLKTFLTGYWGALMSPVIDNMPLTKEHLPERCLAFNARPRTWFEQGAVHVGTELGYDRTIDAIFGKIMHAHLDSKCELFVDLGCGWGHRMFDVWRAGIATSARYVGGDRSDGSRNLVQTVAKLFPGMDVNWFPFDFLHPEFTTVPGTPKRVCIMTCAAIEQVKYIGPALFDRIIARFPDADITGIHFEPITFQFGNDYPTPPYVDVARDLAAAEGLRYNMDLYPVVKAHPRLEITAVEQALLDSGNGNSFSLLVWRSTPPGRPK